MIPLAQAVAEVPAVCLSLSYRSDYDTFLPPILPAKLRGAFAAAMKQLVQEDVPPSYEERVREAMRHLRPVKRSVVLNRGRPPYPLHFTKYLLGVPWAPQPVGPQMTVTFEILLLGDAAALWDVWAVAADSLLIEDVPLTCVEQAVIVDGWLHPIEKCIAEPTEAVGSIQGFAGNHPTEDGASTVDAVRVHLLTPTCWDDDANYDPRNNIDLARLISSAFTRMSTVCGVGPTEAEQELRDAILPTQVRVGRKLALSSVQAWRGSRSQSGTSMRFGGLVGHFDLRRAISRGKDYGLPSDLLDLLWLLQATHLGRGSSFGCGRIRIETVA